MKEYCNKTLFQAMKFICIFHKLAIEADEKRQTHRDVHKKYEREKAIKKELGCELIRINPDRKIYCYFFYHNPH